MENYMLEGGGTWFSFFLITLFCWGGIWFGPKMLGMEGGFGFGTKMVLTIGIAFASYIICGMMEDK